MNNYFDLKREIKEHEGLKLKPYKCSAGKLTIGYGRNLDDVGITLAEANSLFEGDFTKAVISLKDRVSFFNELNQKAQEVLVNMAFNLGIDGLLKFKKMFKALEAKDYLMASYEMEDSLWYSQVGARSKYLVDKMRNIKA
jgi:lysozyme